MDQKWWRSSSTWRPAASKDQHGLVSQSIRDETVGTGIRLHEVGEPGIPTGSKADSGERRRDDVAWCPTENRGSQSGAAESDDRPGIPLQSGSVGREKHERSDSSALCESAAGRVGVSTAGGAGRRRCRCRYQEGSLEAFRADLGYYGWRWKPDQLADLARDGWPLAETRSKR